MDDIRRYSHPRLSAHLSYPNPSLGELAGSANADADLTERLAPRPGLQERPPVKRAQQVVLILCLLMGLFFSTLDTAIVSTSLVTISKDLDDFINAPWVVLAYMLTYMGFAVCTAKLSDIYGRRNLILFSWIIFIAFSMACAVSKNMHTLIICRAFQGLGASGLFSLTQVTLLEIGPGGNPAAVGALIGATLAMSSVLGPILGGFITKMAHWSWIFMINVPLGLAAIWGLVTCWPTERTIDESARRCFTKIDFVGGGSLICASGFLVYGIQQGGSEMSLWGEPEIIAALVIAGVSWVTFIAWQILLGLHKFTNIEPVFPARLAYKRVFMAGLLVSFLAGFPYMALTITIPERFQIINGDDPLTAGIHLLPMLGACAVGSFACGALCSRRNNTSPILMFGSVLQLVGVGLMTLLSKPDSDVRAGYGFQVIFGFGTGLSFAATTIMAAIESTTNNDLAVCQGAVSQARVLGGAIGISICTVVFNQHVNNSLKNHLSPQELSTLHRSPTAATQWSGLLLTMIKDVYASAFTQEAWIMMFVCIGIVVVSLFTFEKHPAPLRNFKREYEIKQSLPPSRDGPSSSDTEMGEMATVRPTV